jgi:hypothetical protein
MEQPLRDTDTRRKPVRSNLSADANQPDVRTTMVYTHVLNRGSRGVKSPVDDL